MTAAELIERLRLVPGDAPVWVYLGDGHTQPLQQAWFSHDGVAMLADEGKDVWSWRDRPVWTPEDDDQAWFAPASGVFVHPVTGATKEPK